MNGACQQLGCADKKVQNSFFVRPTVHGANIFKILFTIFFVKQIFGEAFTSHIQLVLNIFITFYFFLIELPLDFLSVHGRDGGGGSGQWDKVGMAIGNMSPGQLGQIAGDDNEVDGDDDDDYHDYLVLLDLLEILKTLT